MANTHQPKTMKDALQLLIVEDEAVIRSRLERLYTDVLHSKDLLAQITCVSSLQQAKDTLTAKQYDLMSLDLNLNGNSGFELLQHACCSASHCVIVSAWREQAVQAFEYGVLDFIAKPFSRQRLDKAITRFLDKERANPPTAAKYLLVKNGGDLLRLQLYDIESISGYGNYSRLCLQNQQEYLHEKGLDNLLQLLPAHFLRVHKSHILNLDKFQRLNSLGGGQYQVETLSGKLIPVGRSKVAQLKMRLTQA